MGTSIRNIFTFTKKSRRQQDKSRESSLSPTSSVASFSTMSTSGPQTPTTPSDQQDIRGIFRTLEPYWSFYHPQHHAWFPFDMDQTSVLEQHYQQGQTKSMKLVTMDGMSCTVYFQQQKQQPSSLNGFQLIMGQSLHRTLVPVWWFEQELPDGHLGMCRFEQHNQVRLETLADDRTRLSLVDIGLKNASTTVIMSATTPGQAEQEEEMRGLMYVHHPHPIHSLGQKLQDLYPPLTIDDTAPIDAYDLSPLQRRGSI